VASTADVFRLTGVVVIPGTEAPSAARSPLIMRPYDQELLICQRYYCKSFGTGQVVADNVDNTQYTGTAYSVGNLFGPRVFFPVRMRAAPTVTPYQPGGVAGSPGSWSFYTGSAYFAGTTTFSSVTDVGFGPLVSTGGFMATFGSSYIITGGWSADARL
jgi:hypothetical protein